MEKKRAFKNRPFESPKRVFSLIYRTVDTGLQTIQHIAMLKSPRDTHLASVWGSGLTSAFASALPEARALKHKLCNGNCLPAK